MNYFDHLIVVLFAGLYPAYDFFYSIPKFKKNLAYNKPGIRKREYRKSIVWIWILSIIVIVIWRYHDWKLVDLGIDFTFGWKILLSILLFILASIYMFYLYRTISQDTEQRSILRTKISDKESSDFLPHNIQDFRWFCIVSISAGICEELLYRGFLLWYFNFFTNTVVAIVVSSILFGLAHLFQGWKGCVQASVAGLFLAIIYLLTGSLWIPITLHIIGDLYSGLLGWLAFNDTRISDG